MTGDQEPAQAGAQAYSGKAPAFRVDGLLRAARHRGDVSQREMAERAGVNRSVVARIEAGLVQAPSFAMVLRLLATTGCRLVAFDAEGRLLTQRPYDDALDAGHRRWPSHLEVREVHTESDWWYGMFLTDMRPLPPFTTDRRRLRNTRRRIREYQQGNTPPIPEVTDAGEDDG